MKVLSRVFRGKFLDLLQRIPSQCRPDFSSTLVHTLLKQDWVVYVKPAFGGPTHVLRYLGRYTHRVAISNQRLLSFDGYNVGFRWKGYAHGKSSASWLLLLPSSCAAFARCAAPGLCPHPLLRLSRQCSPNRSAGTRSPSARRPTSTRSARRQLSASHLALSTLRSQHVHRPQPYRATTGLPMQTVRHLMIPTQSNGSQTCADTSSHNYVRTTKPALLWRFLAARKARIYLLHPSLSRVTTFPGSHFQSLPLAHWCRISPSAP